MRLDIWSDVVCPFCYIGKRRVEAALLRFEHADEVRLTWHSFQLDPAAPRSGTNDPPGTARVLAAKYGVDIEQARAMNARVTSMAAGEGLDFRLDSARRGNTLDAHRLLHEAAAHGFQGALKERLLRAYFTEGERIDDRGTLLRLAADAGLDGEVAAAVLDGDRHADAVYADQAEAAALGATGVPFVVLEQRYGITGAQSVEVFLSALERAWAEREPDATGDAGAGPPQPPMPRPNTSRTV